MLWLLQVRSIMDGINICIWYCVVIMYDFRYPQRERQKTLRRLLYDIEQEEDLAEVRIQESSSDDESGSDEIKCVSESVSASSVPSLGHKRKSQSTDLGILTL